MSSKPHPEGERGRISNALSPRGRGWVLVLLLVFGGGVIIGRTWMAPVPEPGAEGPSDAENEEEVWTCVMHVRIREPEPGRCRLCGMDLVLLEESTAGEPDAPVLVMSDAAISLAEIETVPVQRKIVEAEIRLVGKVDFDETRLAYITSWVPGRLDRLYVDYTGVPVRKGDHLVYIYSPEVRIAQEELLAAVRGAAALQKSAIASETGLANIEAAREKLRLWGLTPDQIVEIEERGTASDHMTIYAPIGGVVVHKSAVEGMYVETGTRIYTIADLDHVWVKLDAYESDLMWIRYGQQIEFHTVAYPGKVFRGQISFIDPVLNERTRTVKVRVNVANPDRRLKPGMFVRAIVRARVAGAGRVMDPGLTGKWICPMHPEVVENGPGQCNLCGMDLAKASDLGYQSAGEVKPSLVIPVSAPLITGKRAVVYVRLPDRENPTFEGREVVLGPRAGGHYLVESGLAEGEQVVVRGAFKIDSSLQIQAKPSMMSSKGGAAPAGHHHGARMPPKRAAVEPSPPREESTPGGVQEEMGAVLEGYLEYHAALYASDTSGAAVAAGAMRKAVRILDVRVQDQDDVGKAWEEVSRGLHNALDPVETADGLEGQRAGLPVLTEATKAMLTRLRWKGKPVLFRHHCPMAFGMGKGADWLQTDDQVRNPFYGKGHAMEACGTVEERIAEGEEE